MSDTTIGNPSPTPPSWWADDPDPAWRWGAPIPGLHLDCGCHIRRGDCDTVLCDEHLAELNNAPLAMPRPIGDDAFPTAASSPHTPAPQAPPPEDGHQLIATDK